jgi:hypothetical protein
MEENADTKDAEEKTILLNFVEDVVAVLEKDDLENARAKVCCTKIR